MLKLRFQLIVKVNVLCPRSIMDDWINRHMDIELFKKIPFEKFKYAHLQGCLLNPNIIELKSQDAQLVLQQMVFFYRSLRMNFQS